MDARIRDLERRADYDSQANLQLQTLQIKSGTWTYPEDRFAKDIDSIREFLSLHVPEWNTGNLYTALDGPDTNKDSTLINYGWRIFTNQEVNQPGSFIHSSFLVTLALMYPTSKGILEKQLSQQYFLARSITQETHPLNTLSRNLADAINSYLLSRNKIQLTVEEEQDFDHNIKLQTAPCHYCSRVVSWSRSFADERLPAWVGTGRNMLWDFSGQSETSDNYAGHSVIDPATGETQVVCFRSHPED